MGLLVKSLSLSIWWHKSLKSSYIAVVEGKIPCSTILGGESDDVPSSAFIHGDDEEMVEHGIFPSTTATYDDLSDLCHHIESESDFTTSPIYDELPQFPCEESHNPTT